MSQVKFTSLSLLLSIFFLHLISLHNKVLSIFSLTDWVSLCPFFLHIISLHNKVLSYFSLTVWVSLCPSVFLHIISLNIKVPEFLLFLHIITLDCHKWCWVSTHGIFNAWKVMLGFYTLWHINAGRVMLGFYTWHIQCQKSDAGFLHVTPQCLRMMLKTKTIKKI